MQILNRAKNAELDIVSASESESLVREEVNRRTWKAGYTDRDGQMKTAPKIRSMPANERYRENYVKIFGHD